MINSFEMGKIKIYQRKGGMKMKVTKDMLIGDIIREYPEAINILMQNGLGCVG